MNESVEVALRALRHRDRSAAEVDRYLEARGVEEGERQSVLETLVRTGLVDDRRYAESRASSLSARGAGDGLIRHELSRAGVPVEIVEDALSGIAPEDQRVALIVARRGAGPKTARYLAGKGFSEDVVLAAVARSPGDALG